VRRVTAAWRNREQVKITTEEVNMPLYNLALYNGQECAWKSDQRAFLDEDDAVSAALSEYERILEDMSELRSEWSIELKDFFGNVSRFAWYALDKMVLH
jgi:hypothetical protein